MGSLSIWHWLIVLVIVVLVFGTGKLKNMGKDLGGAIKGFKEGMKEGDATRRLLPRRPSRLLLKRRPKRLTSRRRKRKTPNWLGGLVARSILGIDQRPGPVLPTPAC